MAMAKSWQENPSKGEIPKARKLRIWLTDELSYRIRENIWRFSEVSD